eukprot:m.115345 g.115345  ORF g.115345 m.115345 type:complete len:117 (+) comp13088_c0_seq5:279-629(+)
MCPLNKALACQPTEIYCRVASTAIVLKTSCARCSACTHESSAARSVDRWLPKQFNFCTSGSHLIGQTPDCIRPKMRVTAAMKVTNTSPITGRRWWRSLASCIVGPVEPTDVTTTMR